MEHKTRHRLGWTHGTITIYIISERYKKSDRITYEYTVRKGDIAIERNTTHSLDFLLERLCYYKNMPEEWLQSLLPNPETLTFLLQIRMNEDTRKWLEKTRGKIPRSTFLRSIIIAYRKGTLRGEVRMDVRPRGGGRQ